MNSTPFAMSLTAAAAALSVGMIAAPASAAEDCGRVSIAEMNWASAGLAAWVDKIILEEGYGCDVALVAGDTMPTFTSMNEKAEPDVAPELWVNAVKEPLDKAVEEGRIVVPGEILVDGGVEGFWIPKWLSEQENITTIEQALARPELFKGGEDDSKGSFFSCPSGWACQLITQNQFRAMDGEAKGFELVDPGSAAGLDGALARSFDRKEGWLGYYWAPTAMLGKYDMVKLDLGVDHDPEMWHECIVKEECADPKLSEFPRSEVFTAVTKKFAEDANVVVDYVAKRSWSNDIVNQQLSWMADNQASNEDGAYHFLESHPEVWAEWVDAETADKVKAAL